MKEIKIDFSDLLMAFIVLMIFAFFFTVLLVPRVAENKNLSEIIIALIGTLGTIVGYRWGSSKSSAAKDATIEAALKDANTNNSKTSAS